MTDEPEAKERLTYVGRRIIDGKLRHCFYEGEEGSAYVFYPKAKANAFIGLVIGATYEYEKGRLPRLWHNAKVGTVAEEKRVKYQAADRADYLASQQKNVDASPELSRAIETLRTARRAVAYSRHTLFDAWVLNQIKGG